MAAEERPPLPIQSLADRHPGLTPAIADGYYEATTVCLHRHHVSPADVTVETRQQRSGCVVTWTPPTERVSRAWANEIDATRDAAYCASLAAVELVMGLLAISRAETRTGADYYVSPVGAPVDDLENCLRLEVSGTDHGNDAVIQQRLLAKLAQLREGNSNLPAVASVVGFKALVIALAELAERT